MEQILQQWGNLAYGIAILFGGLIGVNYMPSSWEQKFRFLAFAMIVAIIFVLLEVFVQKNFKAEDATRYLITFCIVAVCYQYLLKGLFEKWGWIKKDGTEPKQP